MKNTFLIGPLVVIAAMVWIPPHVDAQQTPQGAEAAIRKAAQAFTEAFDRGDSEALAKHFTMDGVYIDEDGQQFEGRDSIQKEYAALFANSTDLRLQLEIDSIQVLGATTAIEEGRVALTPQPSGAIRVISTYTAIHSLQDGKWLMAHVRDNRVELPPDYGQLEDLDWLVGTWTAASKDAHVEVKSRWVENNHFLARSHSVTESEKVTSTGLQIIGLDSSTGQITSWSFDSDGGHAVGLWAPHDNGWIVESVGVMSDGTQTIATDILSRTDKDTLVWKSADRSAGETALPDTQEVRLTRQ